MKNLITVLFVSFFISLFLKPACADEGMWIPMFLKEQNETEMKTMGMRLSAEDIYSVNKASMKDAIVLFGRGCTGEIVSQQGLMLTNHHCGYGRIQSHSSVEKDLLTNGFWAMSLNEELPNPGLEASILVYMEDVTEEILKGITNNMKEDIRQTKINDNIKKLVAQKTKDTHYTARVAPFYFGNQYILMVYEVFKDVRLVGAPPSCVGKFGGDTDNWMWPRHTGDFAWFRIYADKDNKPAEYSTDNVPYHPKFSFTVSLKGVKENDFTFVFGYPGSTNQFATSHAITMITQWENPVSIEMRRKRMDVMEKYMNKDKLIKIQYSAKHASVANFWKKMIGENKGIQKINGIMKKQLLEQRFVDWVKEDENRKQTYGGLIDGFAEIYEKLIPASFAYTVFAEGAHSIELIRFILQFNQLYQMSVAENIDESAIQKEIERLKTHLEGFFKDYSVVVDEEIALLLLPFYYRVNETYAPEAMYTRIDKKYKSDMQAYVKSVFKTSMFTDKNKVLGFLNNFNPKKDGKRLGTDAGFVLMTDLLTNFRYVLSETEKLESGLDSLYRIYVRGLMDMDQGKRFYPDANSTLRVTYGKVASYVPFDAAKFNYFTTTAGIIEKSYQDYPDYVIDETLYQFLKEAQFGKYATNGTMNVAFVATNHTTGGNSGSPVLNADGHLIGINFDRVWEGTMSDLFYDASFCRNVAVDIRYVLLITDKFAGAGHLIKEMKIAE